MPIIVCHASFSLVDTDSRIQHCVTTLREKGYDVRLVGYGAGLEPRVMTLFDKLLIAARQLPSRILPWQWGELAYWSKAANRKMYQEILAHSPDIIHVHDWTALPAGAAAARKLGAKLIYDSHEYGSGQRLQRRFWRMVYPAYVRQVEGRYIHQASHVITVSPGIAKLLQEDYQLKSCPHVIRSTPYFEKTPFRPVDPGRIIVHYHGIFMPGRGLQNLVRSVALWPKNYHLRLTGWGNPAQFEQDLARLAQDEGVLGRITFHPKVSLDKLVAHAAEADIGICFWRGDTLHLRLAQPNKFFEYNMAGLMQITASGGGLAGLLEQYSLGCSLPDNRPKTLAKALASLDTEEIEACKRNALAAAGELSWEQEQKKLLAIYHQL